MGEHSGTVVWQRRYDLESHRRSLQRFWKFYGIPAAAIIAVTALISGVGPAAGWLILFGLFGAMLFVWVWLRGRNERANPVITEEAGQLLWARRQVEIDQVRSFSTFMSSASMSMARTATSGSTTATASLGVARFVLVDASEVDFVWAALDTDQLAELRSALETVLPGLWRPRESLRDDR